MVPKTVAQIFIMAIISVFGLGASSHKEHLMAGATMGTTYHIKIIAPRSEKMEKVNERIDHRLKQLNTSMSTYRKDSEISRFNNFATPGQPFIVSEDFLKVMQAARNIHQLTNGAWDATVHPLVDLWGFGQSGTIAAVPSSTAIRAALEKVGLQSIEVSEEGFLNKRQSDVTVNLASIAKGYGVDVIARLITALGYQNYLVEIGGEVYASGRRLDGKYWKVGVNRPNKGAAATDVYRALKLQNRAMATSGDYRNYIVINGVTYSHILDPRTGYPVSNGVVSASVIAPNCTLADGLATGLMVMGPAEGLALLNRLKNVEGLIIVRRSDGGLEDHWSNGILTNSSSAPNNRQ